MRLLDGAYSVRSYVIDVGRLWRYASLLVTKRYQCPCGPAIVVPI